MPNIFAYVMLLGWPLISLYFYKRFETITATFLTIVGGYLLLPVKVNVDLPLIPALDKSLIPSLFALIGCVFVKKLPISLLPALVWQKVLVVILVITPLFTVITNQSPVFNGEYWIKGLIFHDSISAIIEQYIRIVPFIICTQIIKTEKDFIEICKLFTISGLIYSVPILYEIRMSPQLHSMFYGFFPHSFAQQIRFDGFRPVVFLGHGLLVGIYMMAAFAFSCILWKRNIRIYKSISPMLVMLFLFFILVASKAVGAIVFGLIIIISILFLAKKLKKIVVYTIFFLVVFYPVLCIFNLFPHQEIINYVVTLDTERAQSLDFRFYHEALLLEHSREQLLFGWGGWGRNRLAGSVTDGLWIIEFSSYGVVGFVALFGLIGATIIQTLNKVSILRNPEEVNTLLISALIVALILVDQIVNSSLGIWVWLFVGSLFGRTLHINKQSKNI